MSRPSRKNANLLAVADHLHSASIHLLRRLRKVDVVLGLTGPKLSALSVLVFGGPRTLGGLAEAENVRVPTMSRLVDQLVRDGLVLRRAKPGDRRAVLLEATTRGIDLLGEGRAHRVAQLAERLSHLSPTELETVGQAVVLLERLLLEEH